MRIVLRDRAHPTPTPPLCSPTRAERPRIGPSTYPSRHLQRVWKRDTRHPLQVHAPGLQRLRPLRQLRSASDSDPSGDSRDVENP
jgi:hypothetical protein